MAAKTIEFKGPDGIPWGVEVKVPGSSNAMIVFHHPGGRTARLDRYAWHQWHGPEARSVTGSLRKDAVMKAITPAALSLLFRRSMPISAGETPLTEVNPGTIGDTDWHLEADIQPDLEPDLDTSEGVSDARNVGAR